MNFIDAHDFSVGLLLRVLQIPPSTYYDWRTARRQPSPRAREDTELLRLIDEIRGEHEFAATYGSPRVWLQLRNRGIRVSRKRVERIMRVNGRKGAYLRRGWTHGSCRYRGAWLRRAAPCQSSPTACTWRCGPANLAARLEAEAGAGELIVADDVHDKIPARFTDSLARMLTARAARPRWRPASSASGSEPLESPSRTS